MKELDPSYVPRLCVRKQGHAYHEHFATEGAAADGDIVESGDEQQLLCSNQMAAYHQSTSNLHGRGPTITAKYNMPTNLITTSGYHDDDITT